MGAAGRPDRALRQGRHRAPPVAEGRARRRALARPGHRRLGRARRRGQAAGRGPLRARDDRRRAARRPRRRWPRAPAGGCGCRSPPRSPTALGELPGARFDERALRCAHRLRVGLEPAPATLSLIESVGEPRFKLDVNWDPETIPAFLALPACEAHGRSLPVDPYLLEPLEHYLRTFERRGRAQRRRRARAPAGRARRRDRGRPPLARPRRAGAGDRGGARRRAAPVPARRRRLRAEGAPRPSSPTSRASARRCRRWPRSRPTTPTRPSSSARPR